MEMHYGITDSKPWGWSRRQASRRMSFSNADYYPGELEYATAVAAAAYAITSLESASPYQRGDPRSQSHPSMARPYYRDEDSRRNGYGKVDRTGSTLPEKIIRQVPSMKRTPTFSGSKRYTGDIESQINTQIPTHAPAQQIPFGGGVNKSRVQESEADDWERDQLEKIKHRYEKLYTTIREWEDKKRKNAERKLRKTEGELGKRRAKALQSYQNDIERIRQVAEGARTQGRDKRRKEEMKVKEKASKLRTTGQLPGNCLCF